MFLADKPTVLQALSFSAYLLCFMHNSVLAYEGKHLIMRFKAKMPTLGFIFLLGRTPAEITKESQLVSRTGKLITDR
jgi:hypothetical protein